MTRLPLLLALLLALQSLFGCAAYEFRTRGDRALKHQQYHEAVVFYEQAARADKQFLSDDEFQLNLREARWRAAWADSQRFSEQRHWPKAVEAYERVLEHNPGYEPALQGLQAARAEAADALVTEAVAHADAGNANDAADSLERALQYVPAHQRASQALRSLRNPASSSSFDDYQQTRSQMRERRWRVAAGELRSIIDAGPLFLPARTALHEATQMLSRSTGEQQLVSKQLDARRLDAAIQHADAALAIWPFNTDASQLRDQAVQQREAALATLNRTRQHLEAKQWDNALAAAESFAKAYRDHAEADAIVGDVRRSAAAYHNEQGAAAQAQKRLDLAEAHFRKALSYQPDDAFAKVGLADILFNRGQGAEAEGLPGNALLWFADARRFHADERTEQAVKRARAAIIDSATFGVEFRVVDANGRETVDTKALKAKLLAYGLSQRPAYVALTNPAALPAGTTDPPQPDFTAGVTLNSVFAQQQQVENVQRVHHYTDVRHVPNPRVSALEHRLATAQREAARARRHLILQRCDACAGHGHVEHRHGKEVVRHPCSRCGGSGHYRAYDEFAYRRAEREVDRLRRDLAREPRLIEERFSRSWPYRVETYTMTGDLDAAVTVQDNAAGQAVQSFDANPRRAETDSVVIGANPQIGLREDPLSLPTNSQMRDDLFGSAAATVLKRTIEATAVAQANRYISRANAFAEEGKADLDIESRMTAVVILEPIKPDDAERLLTEIRNPR